MSEHLNDKLADLRQYFLSGVTRPAKFRVEALKKLRAAIYQFEEEIYTSLYADLRKGREEIWITETGFTISEISNAISNVDRWMQPESRSTNMLNFPSKSYVIAEPLGTVLIMAPWNYPFNLLLTPLIGAIAAGNCVVLKPSEFAPATAAVIRKIIATAFAPEHVLVVEGDGATVVPAMMNDFNFDHVFYTGSTAVGRSVYKMAAEKLIPVTLELGGKSPCVVEDDANIEVAARRIVMTKFSNAGQMCVAPDYLLVNSQVVDKLVTALRKYIRQFFGEDPQRCEEFGRIINEKQWKRLVSLIDDATVLHGGGNDINDLYIEPTLLTNILPGNKVMTEEIFGPVLPVIPYATTAEAMEWINRHPNPLAFYVFTSSRKKEKEWLTNVPFGGGCVNNSALHLTNAALPFGGRGASGTGRYHGKYSFDTFSHFKAIMKSPTWFDPALKYPPLKGKLKLLRWLIR